MDNINNSAEKEKIAFTNLAEQGRWVVIKAGDNRWKVYQEGNEEKAHYEDRKGNIIE